MSILERREGVSEAVIKDRFIRQQLEEESKEIDNAQQSLMSRRGFNQRDWFGKRSFQVTNNTMIYTHLPKHRFVDMRSRNTKTKGRINKKSHPVHNRIMFGHANDIIKRLHFGFTQSVKEQLSTEV